MQDEFLPFKLSAIASGFLLLLSGCEYKDCPDFSFEEKKKALQAKIAKYEKILALSSPGRSALSAAAAAPADLRLALKAGPPSPFPLFKNLPNLSSGKFISQVTVAYSATDGFIDAVSSAGLKFTQPQFPPDGRRRYLALRYNRSINGLTAFVGDIDGSQFGTTLNLPDSAEADLRIEQTDTQLIFSARPTPADQGAGGWTPLEVIDTPPDPAPFALAAGMRDVEKGATFYFTHFAADGEGLGGEAEQRVIGRLKNSIAAIEAGKGKISAATLDLPGALVDLDAAKAALEQAFKDLMTAFVDRSLQSQQGGLDAQKTMIGAAKDLATVRKAVALLDPVKAKAQIAKLDKIIAKEQGAIGNVLGWKAPSGPLPPDLFSLGIP